MTFQEKYAKQRQEAQKVLKEERNGLELEACADVIFEAIYDKLDEKVKKEYNVDRIKESKPISLHNEFCVEVEFYKGLAPYPILAEVGARLIDLDCDISTRQKEFEEILRRKLYEVGVKFKKIIMNSERRKFEAILIFNDNFDS